MTCLQLYVTEPTMTVQEQIRNKVKEVSEVAMKKFKVDLSNVHIRFDIKGRCAGQACRRGGTYYVRFNLHLANENITDMLHDTVPHEMAHIVCFMNPHLGSNHDYGWTRVCRELGGTGNRCHSMETVYGKGNTYEYIRSDGKAIRLSETRHKRLQNGHYPYLQWRDGARVTKQSQWRLLAVSGRMIGKPTPKPNWKSEGVFPVRRSERALGFVN